MSHNKILRDNNFAKRVVDLQETRHFLLTLFLCGQTVSRLYIYALRTLITNEINFQLISTICAILILYTSRHYAYIH